MFVCMMIFAWLLFNTWGTLLLAQFEETFISGWDELGFLLLCAIFTPLLVCSIGRLYYTIQRWKRMRK